MIEVEFSMDGLALTTKTIPIPTTCESPDLCIIQFISTGFFSWRNSSKGSWFVQALHKMIEKYSDKLDFLKLLTRVNYDVAYDFESNAAQPHMNKKKQVPSIVSMLTKDLYLTPKN